MTFDRFAHAEALAAKRAALDGIGRRHWHVVDLSGVLVFALEVLERALLSSRNTIVRELGIALARGAR